MPVLFCVCDADATTPPGPTITAAGQAPRGTLLRYPYGHFDIYNDPQVKVDQVAFLRGLRQPSRARRTRSAAAERNSSTDSSRRPNPARV